MHHHWLKTESIVLPSTFMRSDRLEKLNMWFAEQLAALKAEGASEKELRDPSLADLALRRIFEEHFDQLRKDEEFIKEAYDVVSDQTYPDDLRKIAAQARKQGELEIGSYLELIADYREMTFRLTP